MKKLLLLCGIIMYCLSTNAQTFTASPTTVASGADVTFTGNGENPTAYFSVIYSATLTPINTLVTASTPSSIVTYNTTSMTATSFKMKFTNPTSSAQTVTVTFTCAVNNSVSGTQNTNYQTVVSVTVNPVVTTPTTYYSAAYSKSFTRNNCGAGYQGTTVSYGLAAGARNSTVSQAAANQLAVDYVNANGQANANTAGACNIIYSSAVITGSFTRNNCDSHSEAGPAVSYTLPAGAKTSIISQADADAQALVVFNTNGQNIANATGTCIIRNKTFITYSNQAFTGSRISRVRIYNSSNTLVYDFNETQLLAGPEIDLGIYKFVVTTVGPISNVVAPNTGWGSFDITLSNTGTGYYAVENTGGTSYTVNSVDTSNSHELVLGIYKTF